MSQRLLKQILYGAFYLALFSGLGYGIYFIAFRPFATCSDNIQNQNEAGVDCGGPCIPCALKNLQPIMIFSPVKLLPLGDTGSLYFQLKNVNDAGAENFHYSIIFYDQVGNELDVIAGVSFIYPRSIKTIVEAPVHIDFDKAARTEVKISDVRWRLADEFPRPNLQTRAVKSEVAKDQIRLTGLVLNNNNYQLSSLNVVAVIYSKSGREISASKTVLLDLGPFEERAFTVILPRNSEPINTEATTIFVDGLR